MMVDYKPVLVIIVFLGSFLFVQNLFGTESIKSQATGNYTIFYNGSYQDNTTTLEGQSQLPQPPDCQVKLDFSILWEGPACLGQYTLYFWQITTYRDPSAGWMNMLIILPLVVVLIWQVILLISDLKKI